MDEAHTNETQLGDVAKAAGVRKLMLTHLMPGNLDAKALATTISSTFRG